MDHAEPTSRRIKEMEVMVADVIIETPDTTTLVLFTGNDRLEYLAGHFLTIDPHQFESLERFTSFLEDLKGKREPPRAYSMSSAPHERYLAVTVKEERYVSGSTKFPPLLSPLLVKRTLRGMLRMQGAEVPPFEIGTGTWRIDLPGAVAKSVVSGMLAATVLRLLGAHDHDIWVQEGGAWDIRAQKGGARDMQMQEKGSAIRGANPEGGTPVRGAVGVPTWEGRVGKEGRLLKGAPVHSPSPN